MKRINWSGASYKEWIGLPAAGVFWVASLICFIFGLAFKSGEGIYLPGIPLNLEMLFSIGLGLANTAIQIVGNDTDKEDLGLALWIMWIGSYLLGVGSNVNYLYQKIGLDSWVLQAMVCWGLGVMIEVAPERLLVKFLRAINILGQDKRPAQAQTNKIIGNQPTQTQRNPNYSDNTGRNTREQRHEQLRKTSPQSGYSSSGGRGQQPVRAQLVSSPRQDDPNDIPEFLRGGMG